MIRYLFFSCILIFTTSWLCGQEKLSVQVKTFDQQLKPLGNLEVALNGSGYIPVGLKGVAIVDISQELLPPTSVTIRNDELEAESWNYSKGVLEIIIRKKNYKVITITMRQPNGESQPGVEFTFHGKKIFEGKTDASGKAEIALGLNEKISGQQQFHVKNYDVRKIQVNEKECIVTIQPIIAKQKIVQQPETEKLSKSINLNDLDSIRSLTVFYSIFKNYKMGDLSESEKRVIDLKFKDLIAQLEDSLRNPGHEFLGRISDSSFVGEDVRNLLSQAEAEKQTLDFLRESFDDKIQVLNEKLAEGGGTLDAETRGRLLSDINRLQVILEQNEQKFYKNQNDYKQVLNSLKQKFFDIEDLENKLSISEAQRVEERQEFRKRFFTIMLVTVAFAFLTITLIYFSNRLKKQKKELELANGEINRINENLEVLVTERTAMLENAHREMDIFLYKASHDLRGPICSIIGLCNIASRTVNSESLEIVQKTYNTAFAMDRMLKKLKVISEINHPSNFSVVMLDEYIRAIKQEFRKFVRDNSVVFRIDCPAAISFHSYPNLVEVILTNLVENALFFSTINNVKDSIVEIRAVHKKSFIEISVRDNGIGIEEEIQERIFDMFFIGSEFSHGNGLGLYIVRKAVHALQGELSVQSEKGKYTLITVRIPVQGAMPIPPRKEQHLLAVK
jgi:signal transduction histidine kinase